MTNYNKEEFLALHTLTNLVRNVKKPNKVREVAKRVLNDQKLFKEYVLLQIQRKKDKVRKEKLDSLSGWRKWFKMVLPDRLILG